MNKNNIVLIELKAYTLSQLAGLYKVDRKTFRRWLKPFDAAIGKRIGYLYSIPQVRIIFSNLGFPSSSIEIENLKEESIHEKSIKGITSGEK